eukprot:TRINITY_DN251_c0_g1_i1.p1 TRINITY_DN251_c0_g1~~TRINITY_DN251_c0_g1_i1.p1  ORF type:complete len:514 (-),score=77.54 TRINITY_DN251_c0_g1_i1:368-1909(-)
MIQSQKVLYLVCACAAAVSAYFFFQRHNQYFSWYIRVWKLMEKFRKSCETPTERLQSIVNSMVREMEIGLTHDTEGAVPLKMLPSFVDNLPDGSETGLFYALDLGGTNFRVLRVMLGGKEARVVRSQYEEVPIPESLMLGTTEQLFDFIAEELGKFVSTEGPEYQLHEGQKRELGFTFSFPVQQTAINAGTLISWTKGFNVSGTVGRDVVAVLDDALKRKKVDMYVAALVNDTVGTLAGACYTDIDCAVAVILGTGTNACYVEQIKNIKKWAGPPSESLTMVINMEWGNFWCPQLPICPIDEAIDKESTNPGVQKYEKLISGMYLGEIVRRELVILAQESALFGDEVPTLLSMPRAIPTPLMSKMHSDDSADLSLIDKLLSEKLEIYGTTYMTRRIVYEVIEIVVARAARLAAAGIVGVLKKIKRVQNEDEEHGELLTEPDSPPSLLDTSVAIDGGMYEHYPKFRNIMHNTVKELVGEPTSKYIKMYLSKDGSGIGAALLAASHSTYTTNARG